MRGPDQVPIANLGFFSEQPGGYPAPTLALPGSPNYASLVNETRSQYLHNTATTGRAGIDFTPTKESLLYVSYSRGYRSAAFNSQFLFTPSDFSTVQPETLDSIEAGFKTTWIENRLQLDGAVFRYQYKNQQLIDVRPSGAQPLINLGRSRIVGGELELVARPVRTLTLRAGLGLLDAKVRDGAIADGTINVDGHFLPEAPKVSGTLAGDRTLEFRAVEAHAAPGRQLRLETVLRTTERGPDRTGSLCARQWTPHLPWRRPMGRRCLGPKHAGQVLPDQCV